MKYAHIRSMLFDTPLLLSPHYAGALTSGLAERLDIEPMMSQADIEQYHRPNFSTSFDRETGIVTMPIVGALTHRLDMMDAMSGAQSYTRLHNSITSLLGRSDVKGILLDIDSGGGQGAGLEEFCDFLKTQNQLGDVPIWAIANTCAASAAYWLASSCERLYIAPSAEVGSIGVYVQHQDVSKAMEKRGIVNSFVYAGEHKLDGNPFEALSDDVRADVQASVDALYETFTAAVAANRGMSVEDVKATQARMYAPKAAIDLGLADGEGTLGEVLRAFSNNVNKPQSGTIYGAHMTDRAQYTQSDMDRAIATARNEGVAEGKSTIDAARLDERKSVGAALAEIFPNDPRAETFAEALNDGTTVATAKKFAMKHEAPKGETIVIDGKTATQADVEKLLAANAGNVSADDDEEPGDDRTKRREQIARAAKSHNIGRGYVARPN